MWRFIFFGILVIWVSPYSAAAVVPGGMAASNTYAEAGSTAESSAAAITIEESPSTASYYFWAHQFFLTAQSDHNGYFGLQTNGLVGGRWVGKMVIFSIWNATDAIAGAGSTAQTFGGEGVGYSIRLPYEWSEGVEYRFHIFKEADFWWALEFQPEGGTSIYLGKIKITEDVVLQGASANFAEYFTSVDACERLPYARARFATVSFDDIPHDASRVRTYGSCADNARAYYDSSGVVLETGIIEGPRSDPEQTFQNLLRTVERFLER